METMAQLKQKLSYAEDLKSLVRTKKTVAASNIGQTNWQYILLGSTKHLLEVDIYWESIFFITTLSRKDYTPKKSK